MTEPDLPKDDYNIDFEKIKELISEYEKLKKSGEIWHKNETETRDSFIDPLFKALGWNMENRLNRTDSVSKEEKISKKRVDYGFRINGIPKFFLEAKSLREENIQTNSEYVKQAINYAWMKSCSWAILTNFETIAVYNADWKDSIYPNNFVFVFRTNDFLTNKNFIYLSKKAFENDELDNYAETVYKKQLKNPINKQLLQDMIHFREVLSKDIVRNNQDKHLTQDDIDESVQRILDRSIFIRNAEDRGLEENQLQSIVRQRNPKGNGHLVKEISRIYKEYDDKYNSKLFAHHLCDGLYIDNEALQEVINGLNQSQDNSYRYDFSIIESDVLGNIYEQYLGNILKSTPKRAKLEESKTHRKEQGIYYTPSYIVDYIVKNTVGEYIKTHTSEQIRKVRILDPACGSGSFLIRAYKELENYWKQNSDFAQLTLESEEFYSKKVEILKNNIFGVDLDPKAVEIAQLNLLLQISEKKQRLPLLQNNIKVGNSLIDDPSVSDRAFKWEEEFPEIMKEGGFDIVIGNPPYIAWDKINRKERSLFEKGSYLNITYNCRPNHADSQPNYYLFFMVKGTEILTNTGTLSFIVPQEWLYHNYANSFRSYLLNSFKGLTILQFNPKFKVFKSLNETVGTNSLVISLRKQGKESFDWIYLKELKEPEILNRTSSIKLREFQSLEKNALYNNVWKHINPSSGVIKRKLLNLQNLIFLENRNYFEIFGGFQPPISLTALYEISEKELRTLSQSEKEVCYALIYDANKIRRYYLEYSDKYWIIVNDIKSEDKLKESYPNIYKILYNRIVKKGKDWWKFPNVRNLDLIKNYPIKILSPRTSLIPSFTIDDKKSVFKGTNTAIISKILPPKYVLGIINSSLSTYWYSKFGYDYHGEPTKKYEPEKVKKYLLPIRISDESNKQKIVELVNSMIDLMKKRSVTDPSTDRAKQFDESIAKLNKSIDMLVYNIYELSSSGINIIERDLY